MTDRNEEEDLDQQRVLLQKHMKSIDRCQRSANHLREEAPPADYNTAAILGKLEEFSSIARKANRIFDILFEQEVDEEKMEQDEQSQRLFDKKNNECLNLMNNMLTLKQLLVQTKKIQRDLIGVEQMMGEDPAKDYSGYLDPIQRQLENCTVLLAKSTLPNSEDIWGTCSTLEDRIRPLLARAAAPTAPMTTIIKTEKEKSFDTPKVNIPKFKGGLEEWHSFWGRFKPAVHDNDRIQEPVKMAILLDLVEAPPL